MIPISLTIEGLYSYQQAVTIDFEDLTSAGLFGIFGTVGSGKSSILEAIGFVLYETSERLDAKDKRGYNMLNLKSNAAFISFEFFNFENLKYKFTAAWKRKKKFHEIESLSRNAYIWQNEQWVPLISNDAQPIVGLTYENFKRTTIIPQGKFKEFLELKGKDRSTMMKEIFSLEQFDLSAKVSWAQSKNNAALHELEGKLSTYDAISNDAIPLLNAQIEQFQKDKKDCEQKLFQAENDLKKEETLHAQHLEFLKASESLKEIKNQKNDVLIRKEFLQQYISAHQTFSTDFEKLNLIDKQIQSYQDKLLPTIALIEKLNIEYKQSNEALAKANLALDENENRKKLVQQLQHLIEVVKFSANLSAIELNIQKGKQLSKSVQANMEQHQNNIAGLTEKKEAILKLKIPTAELLNIQEGVQAITNIKKEIFNKQTEWQSLNANIATLNNDVAFEGNKDWQTAIKNKKNEVELTIIELKEKYNYANINQHLKEAALSLAEGKPCPLCGSLTHPQLLTIEAFDVDGITKEISIAEQALQSLIIKEITLQNLQAQYENAINQSDILQEQIKTLENTKSALSIKFASAIAFVEDVDKYVAFKNTQASLEKQLSTIINEIESSQKLLATENETLHKYNDRLQKLIIESAKCEEQISMHQANINSDTVSAFKHYDEQQLLNKMQALESEINNAITQQTNASQLFQSVQLNLENSNHNLQYIKNEITVFENQKSEVVSIINEKIANSTFDNFDTIHSFLENKIDISKEQAYIQEIETKEQLLMQLINSFSEEVKNYTLDEKVLAERKLMVSELKNLVGTLTAQLAVLLNELQQMEANLKIKQALLKEFELIKQRADNLQILRNLFIGAGFVNYISTIYLRKLCDIANLRFHRLTKNQLSLTINENNDFEIIDALNNGYTRSVKTLSGGQMFQASLCLALALAETVKTKHASDKNFFFIDEGFGSLDADALAIVIETLQNLKKENRIVGVISHVDALKESMQKYITIEKDDQNGSKIIFA